jgi:hypothetical protein
MNTTIVNIDDDDDEVSEAQDIEDDMEFVSRIQSERIRSTSKRAYVSAQNMMAKFLIEKFPNLWNSTTQQIILPLPRDVVMQMFGSLSRKSDGTLKSHATVQGYKSSLKNLYRERRVEFDSSLELSLSDFSSGYKRNIADLKEQGKMKLAEGKSHLTFERYK